MSRLRAIAHARSGDKGSNANIGVIAYSLEGYDFLRSNLTEEKVLQFFLPLGLKKVIRYELPNLKALNFVLYGVLERGGSQSLRTDAQGKSLAEALLELELKIPPELLSKVAAWKH